MWVKRNTFMTTTARTCAHTAPWKSLERMPFPSMIQLPVGNISGPGVLSKRKPLRTRTRCGPCEPVQTVRMVAVYARLCNKKCILGLWSESFCFMSRFAFLTMRAMLLTTTTYVVCIGITGQVHAAVQTAVGASLSQIFGANCMLQMALRLTYYRVCHFKQQIWAFHIASQCSKSKVACSYRKFAKDGHARHTAKSTKIQQDLDCQSIMKIQLETLTKQKSVACQAEEATPAPAIDRRVRLDFVRIVRDLEMEWAS